MLLEIISLVPTSLITGQGLWNVLTTAKTAEPEKKSRLSKKRICVVFPSYRDIVDTIAWSKWSNSIAQIIVVEDMYNGNEASNKVKILKRDNREGFKAGALNLAIDYILKNNIKCDYVFFFDADHIPIKSFDDINDYLDKEVIQFYWDDGRPFNTSIDYLTYSARYFSNINDSNRAFKNLSGSAMAININVFKAGFRFPDSITEDYALTLELLKQGIGVDVVPIAIPQGAAPRTFKAFIKQQSRWAEGTVRDARLNGLKVKMSLKQRFDWFMQLNIYLQALWMVMTIVLYLSGLLPNLVAGILIAIQIICYYSQLRKAPIKYWLNYFILNYVIMIPQFIAVAKGLLSNDGYFNRTYKKGNSHE